MSSRANRTSRPAPRENRARRAIVIGLSGLLLAAPTLVWTGAGQVSAATPSSGTVTATHPASWDFAPVGGPAGATDSYQLTVKLPADAARVYAPDARTGSHQAAVLTITQTWTGSDPTQALVMTASDANGNSVGNDTLGTTNDGSDTNVLTVQDPILSATGGGATVTYGANTLVDRSQDFAKDSGASLAGCCWTSGEWKGATVTPRGFPPATVASNTADTLTLTGNWPTAPPPGTPYALSFGRSETFTITASNAAGNSPSAVASHAVATLHVVNLAQQPQPPEPAGGPLFTSYHIPLALMPETAEEATVLGGRAFGEPSIGVDPRTDAILYQAGLYTIKATFDTTKNPATVSWANVSDAPLTNSASEDAILAVDRGTGRVIVSQLTGACSLSAVSDNDGASWTPAAKPCQTPPAVDHQTIGAGPFHAPLTGTAYPDAVYYCSQNVAEAECALSTDGGLTYGAGVPMWTSQQCFGLHGHVKVAPDGTVYVPDKACGSPECEIITSTAGPNCHPGFAVSTDNGATWTIHTISDGHTRLYDSGDPSIGIGAKGTVYFGYVDRDGHPKIAVCAAGGANCSASVDVGAPFHIQNAEMPSVVAGDDNRAAFAFLGSTTPGDDQQNSFVGTWHVYIAVTYDGGQHWTVTDATPNHPVQRGCIRFASSCPFVRGGDDQRDLLDFNDLTIDREGRILYAYTDGCQPDLGLAFGGHGNCLHDATRLSGLNQEIEGPAIARQNCGLGLYAAYDTQAIPCPGTTSQPVTPRMTGPARVR